MERKRDADANAAPLEVRMRGDLFGKCKIKLLMWNFEAFKVSENGYGQWRICIGIEKELRCNLRNQRCWVEASLNSNIRKRKYRLRL
jgi:hypothetical protein